MSEQGRDASLSPAEARLWCLEIAAILNQPSTPAELIKHAEHLLKWIYTS
jgi:hypothetical protein